MERREFIAGLAGSVVLASPGRAADAGASPARIGGLAAGAWLRRADIMRYDVGEVHAVHYAEVACALGALRLASATRNEKLVAQVAARHRRVVELPNTANHVDANVYGVWPIELWRHSFDDADLARGLGYAHGQWRKTTPDGLTEQARFWIDDVWMIGALQIGAWRATRVSDYLDHAALMARRYLERLQQPNGLFHHGPEAPFFWARGNGWVAAGLTEILAELPEGHGDRAAIEAGYRRMMAALLGFQAPSGMWRQLIDRDEAWEESSGSAMFAFAMAEGARRGLLRDPAYAAAARRAWKALAGHVDAGGRLDRVCVGTGQSKDMAYYLARPTVAGDLHGQAALLWLSASLAGH